MKLLEEKTLNDRFLEYAKCPLKVYPLAVDTNNEPLSIFQYYPEIQETVQIDYSHGRREWTFEPQIEVMEIGAQIGNIGGSRTNNKTRTISLRSTRHQELIPRIEW